MDSIFSEDKTNTGTAWMKKTRDGVGSIGQWT